MRTSKNLSAMAGLMVINCGRNFTDINNENHRSRQAAPVVFLIKLEFTLHFNVIRI